MKRLVIGETMYVVIKNWHSTKPFYHKEKIKTISMYCNGEWVINAKHNLALCGSTKKQAKKLLMNAIKELED